MLSAEVDVANAAGRTDSARRAFEKAFTDAGIDPARRLVVVTDPGSPFDKTAREAGYRAVFNADASVGGRFSALTAFGLVPSGLAGADITALLDDAEAAAEMLRDHARWCETGGAEGQPSVFDGVDLRRAGV